MWRIIAEVVIPIALPTLVYAGWLASERRRAARAGAGEPPEWRDAPWLWLGGAGVFLAACLMLGLALFGGETIRGRYVPPEWDGEKIVPGHVEPR